MPYFRGINDKEAEISLTAKAEIEDEMKGFELGAVDYPWLVQSYRLNRNINKCFRLQA